MPACWMSVPAKMNSWCEGMRGVVLQSRVATATTAVVGGRSRSSVTEAGGRPLYHRRPMACCIRLPWAPGDTDGGDGLVMVMPVSGLTMGMALRGRVAHLLHCGTIWVHGHSVEVPTTEDAPRVPFGDYGIRKAEIERYLLEEARSNALPATILHPGHLVGEGWNPINPQGNFEPSVFSTIMRGETLTLPNFGMETVHHVHADDVAQAFVQAIVHRDAAAGESFHVVSRAALTLRGFAEEMFASFHRPANLEYLPYESWSKTVSEKNARTTWDHIAHSPNCSIEKARNLIGYAPQYSSIEAVQQSVTSLRRMGVL